MENAAKSTLQIKPAREKNIIRFFNQLMEKSRQNDLLPTMFKKLSKSNQVNITSPSESINSVKVQNYLIKISGGSVLDVKTGQGDFLPYIQQFKCFDKITAIDRNLDIEALQKKYNNLPVVFLEVDSATMPFPDEFFDTVCISNSLHHMPNIRNTLFEMKRVLKRNGNFIIKEIFLEHSNQSEKSFIMYHQWCAKKEQMTCNAYHEEPYSKKTVITLIKSLGLKNLKYMECESEINGFKKRLPAHTPIRYQSVLDHIDHSIFQFQKKNKYPELIEDGKKVMEQIQNYGFQSAPFLFFTGNKNE